MAITMFPRDSAQYAQIERMFDQKNMLDLCAWISKQAKTGKQQLGLLNTILDIVEQRRGGSAPVPSLGETILIQQQHKLEAYGDNLFALTEKQVVTILRELHVRSTWHDQFGGDLNA